MNQKQAQLAALSIMVLIMTMVVVFISTYMNFGIDGNFLFRFLRGWGVAFFLALPLAIFLMPLLQKFFFSKVKQRA